MPSAGNNPHSITSLFPLTAYLPVFQLSTNLLPPLTQCFKEMLSQMFPISTSPLPLFKHCDQTITGYTNNAGYTTHITNSHTYLLPPKKITSILFVQNLFC